MGFEKPGDAPKISLDSLISELRPQMHGVLVCLSHSWGGLEQTAGQDAIELGRLGIPIKVLVLKDSPIHQNLATAKGVKCVPLDYRPRDYFDFQLRRQIHSLVLDGANLFHTHQTTLLGSIAPWLFSKPQIPLFASRHILNNHNKRNFFHRMVYNRLDSLIVMSQAMKQNVMETHPLRERQVKIVNLGLDFDRFNPKGVDAQKQRREWGADDDTILIGLVGRIDPAKGQATLIKAAAGLKRKTGNAKIKIVIVGEETLGSVSGYLTELKAMVAQFHLEDSVLFTGFQQNIPEVMQALDVFVMPSRQEAFGLVAIEAMAMECPIIISHGGSATEIVGRQEFGLLIRPEDAFDLQRQLRVLVEDAELRKGMGRKARLHVMESYDRKLRLHRTLALYERGFRRRNYFNG